MIRIVLAVVLMMTLTACSFGGPSQTLIGQAIALQVNQTQQQLRQLLYQDAPTLPKVTISHINVAHRDALTIKGLPAYHLQGTYDLALDFSDHHVNQRQNPFDVYLQEIETQIWGLARPKADTETPEGWVITAIDPQA